ncbi:hypothetical protein, partial [Bacillus altitudinis]|uniref:hypothetical protein n=1 Tax=Bacillus altitudinis TaxID=293387 RepID=UPI001C931521
MENDHTSEEVIKPFIRFFQQITSLLAFSLQQNHTLDQQVQPLIHNPNQPTTNPHFPFSHQIPHHLNTINILFHHTPQPTPSKTPQYLIFNFQNLKHPKHFNPLPLPYIPHPIFQLYLTHHLLQTPPTKPNHLHKPPTNILSPKSHPPILFHLHHNPFFTQPQQPLLKTPTNPKSPTLPKNTHLQTYPYTTAFQPLIPYLFIHNHHQPLQHFITHPIQIPTSPTNTNHSPTSLSHSQKCTHSNTELTSRLIQPLHPTK